MESREYKYERVLRDILEVISDDVLKMADFWGNRKPHTLNDQIQFVKDTLFNYKIKNNILSWSEEVKQDARIVPAMPFMLLYDICNAKGLVSLSHPDSQYNVTNAFKNGVFIGWELKFFNTMPEVEDFIKEGKYTSFSLYFNYQKVSFKYGYYIEHHIRYVDEITFLDPFYDNISFIEVQDIFKITFKDKSNYFLCHSTTELVNAAMEISNFSGFSPEEYRPEILVETRHRQYKCELVRVDYEFSLLFDAKGYDYIDLFTDPFNPYSVGCYSACKTFDKFIRGERVQKEEICKDKDCPIDDLFNRYLKFTEPDEYETLCEEEKVDDLIKTSALCPYCDFKGLTRFEEPCYHCNEGMQQQMLKQGQIRFTEEK